MMKGQSMYRISFGDEGAGHSMHRISFGDEGAGNSMFLSVMKGQVTP